ncbi:MAG: aminotransferase class I/II-fold pyridoxal phosphate-dependent enzyme [Deltaproteobacteria bacterium]|nr:MAG: aminotransferase class I/II-fold pyridoxal phosphate-dependent enzyme [Deltaproteobacteria bacterium]TMB46273.1 MAG: aminotransferase class I/II-fold pyridoxal phosphate-dependent enzyme [Deltaproteobacteria bacterium]
MGPLADGSWGTFPVSRLVASSRGLHADLSRLLAIGSSHGALFDRQNLHAATARTVLGPPGRGELNEVADASVPVINLASNSYLELGNDPRVKAAAIAAVERHGTHMGGSRLLCGTAEIHWEFERRLAAFFEASSVVTYGSGYVTNVSLISALFGPGDLIIIDRQAHRSIYDGALLSRATVRRFAHNDLDHLDLVLKRTSAVRRRLVAVDGVYSMNGHICPLPEVASLTRSHGAFLFVDDAHAIGVLGAHGRGTVEHFGLDPELIDIRIGTLSKALPAVGGFALTQRDVAVLLRYTSHGALYSAAMTPPDVAVAMAAMEILGSDADLVERLRRNASFFRDALQRRGLDILGSQTAIVPIRIGDSRATLDVAAALLKRGIFVNPVIYPAVPKGAERLRCFVMASHSTADLEYAAAGIEETVNADAALHSARPSRP